MQFIAVLNPWLQEFFRPVPVALFYLPRIRVDSKGQEWLWPVCWQKPCRGLCEWVVLSRCLLTSEFISRVPAACILETGVFEGVKKISIQVWARQLWLLWVYVGWEEDEIKLWAAISCEPVAVAPDSQLQPFVIQVFSLKTRINSKRTRNSFWNFPFLCNAPLSKTQTCGFIIGHLLIWYLKGETCCCRTPWPIWIQKTYRFSSKWAMQ